MKISFEVAALVAAVISGIVSFVVAWWTASSALRTEVAKLQLSTQAGVFTRLLDSRLDSYPVLYSLVSDLVKNLEAESETSGSVEPASLSVLLARIDDWDSKFSIILGPRTTNVCWEFRTQLREAITRLQKTDEAKQRAAILNKIFSNAEELELALRADLGIYGLSGVDAKVKLRTQVVTSYPEGEAT